MRLEGTLDAFSLPDIFQLLSYTKKTGTLHLRRDTRHGVVHLRDGQLTGARSDATRQALARRLLGGNVVDDKALEPALAIVASEPSVGLGRALADAAGADPEAVRALAADQMYDAVFDLMRWPEGEFAFVVDEAGPDDVGATLSIEEVVAEGGRRVQRWAELTAAVPGPDVVVSLAPAATGPVTLSAEDWAVLAAVDGHRTVADLVLLSGRGEFAVVNALADLVARGVLAFGAAGEDADRAVRTHQLIAQAEPEAATAAGPAPRASARDAGANIELPSFVTSSGQRPPVIPERPEPFTPPRRPEHREDPLPAYAALARPSAPSQGSSVGAVHGSAAMQPEPVSGLIERDPSVNKSLLLRLIAGVRGL